jgi:NAD(P)-dependent dehydrogenase (short-subunit alcohol dehydrogenase family)
MGGRLRGKTAFVSGAGSIRPGWGNGKAAAVVFAREGANVFAVDRTRDAVEETAAVIRQEGYECTSFIADVSSRADVEGAMAKCLETYGRVDVLHNNVGIPGLGTLDEIEEAEWDRVLAVNVKSMYLTSRSAIPSMIEQRSGSIINISSIASTHSLGYPCISYSASKGAVNAFTRDVGLTYAKYGVRCNAILPGLMDTPLIHSSITGFYGDDAEMVRRRNAQCPMGFMGSGWDVAYAALFLASDESRYVTGIELVVDGGVNLKVG